MSSYKKNNYGDVFYNMVKENKPTCLVELGVLHGYSTTFMAKALKENKRIMGISGHLNAYDLFEDYPFKHGTKTSVEGVLKKEALDDFVTISKGDAFVIHGAYTDNSVDFLHVDISNTGQIVRDIIKMWHRKIRPGGIIVFEGGSAERDNIEWMKKYNKPPIRKELATNPIIAEHYTYIGYAPFPSITMLIKHNKRRVEQLKALRQNILDRLIPRVSQEHIGSEGQWWTADWWSIEVLTCLIEGQKTYLKMESPDYLKGNKTWNRKRIAHYTNMKDNMVSILHCVKDDANELLVCEMGRGIDILLASMVKKWDTIHCYDNNYHDGDEVNLYFKKGLHMPINFVTDRSSLYKFADIYKPTILVANSTRIGKIRAKELLANQNIIHIINNGRLIKEASEW